jgi:tetratricopeptide (TPR) repeat protein
LVVNLLRRQKPLRNERETKWTVAALIMLAMFVAGAAAAGNPASKEAAAEMEWGYKAGRHGYWQEALMRFQRANELTPDQPRILNNVAVAEEANGLYEEALLTYQEGLAIAPNNDALRRNYMRFQEFYTTYIAPPEESGEQGTGGEGADDALDNS